MSNNLEIPEVVRSSQETDFWHNGPTVYQIYPRSFKATDGSPEGTIAGITEQLPYLKGEDDSLGVDAIWLTPFYRSRMVDGGYDVTSYREVNPRFGSLEDVKILIAEAHKRELKVMVDFVPNHMSTDSEWYKESSASRNNPKSGWFIYRDAKPDGALPNNWPSEFRTRTLNETTGVYDMEFRSVWSYVPERDQYSMCTFSEAQADLNWHNPEVREAMKDEMRFLLNLGVDGFRVDMVTHIGKHPDIPDEPLNPDYKPTDTDPNHRFLSRYRNGDPSLYTYMQEMVAVLKEYDGRFMVTEDYIGGDDPVPDYLEYYNNVDPKYSAPFSFQNFEFMMSRTAPAYKKFYDKYLGAMAPDFVPTSVLGNHDQSRIVSRIGRDAARAAAVMQLTLPGMPFIYYGEELGMEDVDIPLDKIDDPYDGRDPERTPMLWTPGKNAGFTDGDETWLPLSPNASNKNVQSQLTNPHSFLSLYRRLIRLRHDSPALRIGAYIPHDTGHETVFGYSREHGSERLMTLINFSGKLAVASTSEQSRAIVISSHEGRVDLAESLTADTILLNPFEGLLLSNTSRR
jgi:alpha-glucosidase